MYKAVIPVMLITLLLGFASPAMAQQPNQAIPTEQTLGTSNNKVEGLELPADQTVDSKEGFIVINAISEGPVKWLVIGNVKYIELGNKSIIMAVPHENKQITIFAISWINNEFTDYARHNVTVIKNSDDTVNPVNPIDPVKPAQGPLHVTFLIDLNKTTPQLAQIVNSQAFRKWVKDRGDYFRYYDINSKVIKERKLDTIVSRIGGTAIMVVQNQQGLVVHAGAVPENETEVRNIIRQLGGR